MREIRSRWSRGDSRVFCVALCTLFFSLYLSAHGQQAKSVPRIGYLSRDLHPADSRAASPRNLEAFVQGLRQLGYIEGQTISVEYRYADGRLERLPALAQELIRLNLEIIVTDSIASSRAAKNATKTIPIVMASVGDPVVAGLVTSLARPGGNLTGTTDYSADLLGKRLEVLRKLRRRSSALPFSMT